MRLVQGKGRGGVQERVDVTWDGWWGVVGAGRQARQEGVMRMRGAVLCRCCGMDPDADE